MSSENQNPDALEFIRGLWGKMGFPLPGMITPTLDSEELEKRIADMKAVEGWLKMNLNMLQMTIQGLELQLATLMAVKTMSQRHSTTEEESAAEPTMPPNPFMAMWPWNLAGATPSAESKADEAPKAEPAQTPKPKRPRANKKT